MAAEGEPWGDYAGRLTGFVPGIPVLAQLRDRYVRSVREMPEEWAERYLATRGLAARTPALRDQHTDSTDRLREQITTALEEAFGTDSRQDVRLRLASDMTLAAVRYGSKNRISANRAAERTGNSETLVKELVTAFDALPGAVALTPPHPV